LAYLVDNQGCIDFPVLDKLRVVGLTKSETENLVKSKLKDYLKEEPVVNVRFINYKISVIGEVNRPSTFTIANEKVNVFEALAMAGDLTIYGLRNNVKLIREDQSGVKQIITLNLNDANVVLSPYYYLQQNDILYVTPNKAKAKTSDITSSTSLWVSATSILVSVASLLVTIFK
jgi:polysaccharide export outer membrane protein